MCVPWCILIASWSVPTINKRKRLSFLNLFSNTLLISSIVSDIIVIERQNDEEEDDETALLYWPDAA